MLRNPENAILVYEGLEESRIPIGVIFFSLTSDLVRSPTGIYALKGLFLATPDERLTEQELIHLVLVYSEIISTNLGLPEASSIRYYFPTDEGAPQSEKYGRLAFMVEFPTGVYLNDQERKN